MSELFSEAEKKILVRCGKDVSETELQLREYCAWQLDNNQDNNQQSIVRLKQQLIKNLISRSKRSVSLNWEPSEFVYKQLLKDGYMAETVKYLLNDIAIRFKLGYIKAVDLDAYSLAIVRRSAVLKKLSCKFDIWKSAKPFNPPSAVINEVVNRLNLNPMYKWSENDREKLLVFYHFKLQQQGRADKTLDHDEEFIDVLTGFCQSGLKVSDISII